MTLSCYDFSLGLKLSELFNGNPQLKSFNLDLEHRQTGLILEFSATYSSESTNQISAKSPENNTVHPKRAFITFSIYF